MTDSQPNLMHKLKGKVLVIDLEATCSDDESIMGEAMEIIEIGACWVNEEGEVLEVFQSFVRPTQHPILTKFCTELTTITQDQVDGAPTFDQIAPLFEQFAQLHQSSQSMWCSWGNYDKRQFQYDSVRHKVPNPVEHLEHVNLKALFAKSRKIKQVGMTKALSILGIEHHGVPHRGLDDALGVAKILGHLKSYGF